MAHKSGAAPSYSVTSAGVNPVEDRAHRMRMYFIAMTLRVVCVLSLFWVRGWWIAIPVIGSVVFPWFAVMIGNAVAHGGERELSTPDPLELTGSSPDEDEAEGPQLLVVDVEPVRRAERPQDPAPPDPASPGESADGEGGPSSQSSPGHPDATDGVAT